MTHKWSLNGVSEFSGPDHYRDPQKPETDLNNILQHIDARLDSISDISVATAKPTQTHIT